MPDKYETLPPDTDFLAHFRQSLQTGLRPSRPSRLNYPAAFATAALPRKVDLAPLSIKNQGQWGSCNAFASARCAEGEFAAAGIVYDPSEDYLYAKMREQDNTLCQNVGTDPHAAADIYRQSGVCTEALRPYGVNNLCQRPQPAEIAEAANFRMSSYYFCSTLDSVKGALAAGHRVVWCQTLMRNFQPDPQTGVLPRPSRQSGAVGGHAMCAEGYDDDYFGGGFWIANQWSASFGVQGRLFYRYAYFDMTDWTAGAADEGGVWKGELIAYVRERRSDPQPDPQPQPEPTKPRITRQDALDELTRRYWAHQTPVDENRVQGAQRIDEQGRAYGLAEAFWAFLDRYAEDA